MCDERNDIPKLNLDCMEDDIIDQKVHPYSERSDTSKFKKVGISLLKQNPITRPKVVAVYPNSARNAQFLRMQELINNASPSTERTPRQSISKAIEDLREQSRAKFVGKLNYQQILKMQEEIDESEMDLYKQDMMAQKEIQDLEDQNNYLQSQIYEVIHSSTEVTRNTLELQKKRNELRDNVDRLVRENAYNIALIEIYKKYEQILVETAKSEGYNNWKDVFKTPNDFISYTEKFEHENLFISQQVEQKMEKFDVETPRRLKEELIKENNTEKPEIKEINLTVTNPYQEEYEYISGLVEKLYLLMYKSKTSLSPYDLLVRIEKKMEEIYRSLESVKPSFLKKKFDEIETRNNLERRLQFRAELERKFEEKKKITMERCMKEVKIPSGRKLMPKSSPRKIKVKDMKKEMEEAERKRKEEELLFGDIFSD